MKVSAGRSARASDFAYLLSCADIIADRYIDIPCMRIERGNSVAVVDYAVVAVSASACVAALYRFGNVDYRAGSRCTDSTSVTACDIDAGMELPCVIYGMLSVAVGR